MIFVTGGAGFIGANFVLDWLACSDAHLVNLDKLTYAGNLDRLCGVTRHVFVQDDICNSALTLPKGSRQSMRPWQRRLRALQSAGLDCRAPCGARNDGVLHAGLVALYGGLRAAWRRGASGRLKGWALP